MIWSAEKFLIGFDLASSLIAITSSSSKLPFFTNILCRSLTSSFFLLHQIILNNFQQDFDKKIICNCSFQEQIDYRVSKSKWNRRLRGDKSLILILKRIVQRIQKKFYGQVKTTVRSDVVEHEKIREGISIRWRVYQISQIKSIGRYDYNYQFVWWLWMIMIKMFCRHLFSKPKNSWTWYII